MEQPSHYSVPAGHASGYPVTSGFGQIQKFEAGTSLLIIFSCSCSC